mgnify:CR=1 FL=1|jgi:hypothetical protein
MIAFALSHPDDLYILGLDSHVGFLLKENNEVYFIHSNYFGSSVVTREVANESEALKSSETYYLGAVLSNDKVIRKWLSKEKIRL